jgi:uncharacterized protein
VDAKLLELLVCPVTKGPLVYDREAQELVSKSARLAYPVRDGIAIMLVSEARHIEGGMTVSMPAAADTQTDTAANDQSH